MFLKEISRFFTHIRTFYCYLLLSFWIFLLIAGMYKYISKTYPRDSHKNYYSAKKVYTPSNPVVDENLRIKRYKQYCTPMENLVRRDDGGLLEGWKLQGVLLVIRHGDRGPMSHMKGINSIDCSMDNDNLLHRYRTFLQNQTSPTGPNRLHWNRLGPFHGFALLPPNPKSCLLMQLTSKGIAQLLHVGEIMYQVYAHPLGIWQRSQSAASKAGPGNDSPLPSLNSDEIIVYATRYKRTFQSAMALLYTFIPLEKWLKLNLRESYSMSFCFADCACPEVDESKKKSGRFNKNELRKHTAAASVVDWLRSLFMYQKLRIGVGPYEVRDALLMILCHDAPLPCKKPKPKKPPLTASPNQDSGDVINIDLDEGVVDRVENVESVYHEENDGTKEGCMDNNHITALMSFTNWLASKETRQSYYKRSGLLRAYGFIRHIVGKMLKIISGDRTKFVLYSGHDWTMQYLAAALGINTELPFIPYASRMAFEIYKSETNSEYYFRVVYNGRDVTQQIDFCEGGRSLRVSRDSRGNKADLCPIENIIRFIHDDYFAPLNATNFKDACLFKD